MHMDKRVSRLVRGNAVLRLYHFVTLCVKRYRISVWSSDAQASRAKASKFDSEWSVDDPSSCFKIELHPSWYLSETTSFNEACYYKLYCIS